MLFRELDVAFEEMEFLVKETGRTHMILHSSSKDLPYRVIQRHGWANPQHLVAELNCRNVVGDAAINKRRGRKTQKNNVGKRETIRDGLYQYSAPSRAK